LAEVRTAERSTSVRTVGLVGIGVVAFLLGVGFWLVHITLLPPAPSVARAPQHEGTVYGAQNTNSRFTLRLHRPALVTVSGRSGQALFQHAMEGGDTYRAPNVADLTVTTPDAGAVEVLFDGHSIGVMGTDGVPVQRVPLRTLLPGAAPPAPASTEPSTPTIAAKEPAAPPKIAKTPPARAQAAKPVASAATARPAAPPAKAAPPAAQAAPPAAAQINTAKAPPAQTPVPQPAPLPSIAEQLMAATRNAASTAAPAPIVAISDEAKAKEAADRAKALKELDQRKTQEAARTRRAFTNSLFGINSPN